MNRLKVYYDGSCYLCYHEMMHYKKKDLLDLIDLIDITAPNFKQEEQGLSGRNINKTMHSIDGNRTIFTGVDSFIEIWKRIPRYKRFAALLDQKYIKPLLKIGYLVFAKLIRPWLPKRKCIDTHCKK